MRVERITGDPRHREARGESAGIAPYPLLISVKIAVMSDADSTPQHEQEQEQEKERFRMPLPPASFTFLVLSLRAQAEMQLGLMNFQEGEEVEPDLDLARHTIDMLAVLVEKTKGNLALEEQRLIENSLTELRFRYVQVSEKVSKAKSAAT